MSVDSRSAELQDAVELVERLTEALRERTALACAKGILMERYDVGAESALSLLKRVSDHAGVSVTRMAERVVAGQPVDTLRPPQPRLPD